MDWCERHDRPIVSTVDLVVTRIGPNRIAVMAALRGMANVSPAGAAELVRGGAPITLEGRTSEQMLWDEWHLKLCGAATERVVRSYCPVSLPGDPVDDGAIA